MYINLHTIGYSRNTHRSAGEVKIVPVYPLFSMFNIKV